MEIIGNKIVPKVLTIKQINRKKAHHNISKNTNFNKNKEDGEIPHLLCLVSLLLIRSKYSDI